MAASSTLFFLLRKGIYFFNHRKNNEFRSLCLKDTRNNKLYIIVITQISQSNYIQADRLIRSGRESTSAYSRSNCQTHGYVWSRLPLSIPPPSTLNLQNVNPQCFLIQETNKSRELLCFKKVALVCYVLGSVFF